MKRYGIVEVFRSIQGEGLHVGTPMVFVRFAGCNLWDGGANRTGRGSCAAWCDTDVGVRERLTATEIAWRISDIASGIRVVCITGGEPMLQWDREIAEVLHDEGFTVHMETNGTHGMDPPVGVDWLTVSPKRDATGAWMHRVRETHEVKVIHGHLQLVTLDDLEILYQSVRARYYYLGACDEVAMGGETALRDENFRYVVELVLRDPRWRLTRQLHKEIGLP